MCNTTHARKAHYFAYQLNSKAKSTLATYQCLALVRCVGLIDLVELIGLVGTSGVISLISHNGLVGFIGLGISFIGGFVGFIGLGLVSLGRLISNISLVCFISLGLVGFIGPSFVSQLIGHISLVSLNGFSSINDFSLIGLISLGLVGIISFDGLSASHACRLIGLVSRAILLAHPQPHNLVAAIFLVARKQAAHRVATMLTSVN
jgi:hypothetical protein